MILFTIWFYSESIWWGWEKTPENEKDETKEKRFSLFGCPPIPPSIKLEADCFPGRKNRKQAGPTLGGAWILIYMGKRNKGSGAVWVDISR